MEKNTIFRCNGCGLEFTDPMPGIDELEKFYTGYKDFHAQTKIVKLNAAKNIQFLESYGLTRDMRLLDYGCGKNIFVRQGKSKHWFGYDRFNKNNDALLLRQSFDFVTLWGVLEHLTDPVREMKKITGLLASGGKVALTTVSTETGIPYRHKPPEHVVYWTRQSLDELFRCCGLKMIYHSQYFMYQDSAVYLKCVLNAGKVPESIQEQIRWKTRKIPLVPTNEVIVVGQKK
jgi:SAM-dependent methyltransferase